MYNKILDGIKVLCLCIVVWIVWDLSQYVKTKTDQALTITQQTSEKTLEEVSSIRKDTFVFLDKTAIRLDNRVSSIQTGTFKRVDKTQEELFKRVDNIHKDLNNQLTTTNNTVSKLASEYATIPADVKRVASRFDEQTDCENNELCWQNMTSDLLIDTRNVMRDGSSTFRIVNSAIPKFVNDSTEVSASVAKNMPIIADNIAKTSEHIQKITKPRWYDKILSYGISGGLLYFTAKKP